MEPECKEEQRYESVIFKNFVVIERPTCFLISSNWKRQEKQQVDIN